MKHVSTNLFDEPESALYVALMALAGIIHPNGMDSEAHVYEYNDEWFLNAWATDIASAPTFEMLFIRAAEAAIDQENER